jgi:hypothetical protein
LHITVSKYCISATKPKQKRPTESERDEGTGRQVILKCTLGKWCLINFCVPPKERQSCSKLCCDGALLYPDFESAQKTRNSLTS